MNSPFTRALIIGFGAYVAVLLVAPTSAQGTSEGEKENKGDKNEIEGGKNKTILTGNPQIDYIHDPNLPRELGTYKLNDYPFYNKLPEDVANFTCDNRVDGFYASIPHKCQVYHNCQFGVRYSFMCANYTLFDQVTLNCGYANRVNCEKSHELYHLNSLLYLEATTTSSPRNKFFFRKNPKRKNKNPSSARREQLRRRLTTTTTAAPKPLDDYYYNYGDEYENQADTDDPAQQDEHYYYDYPEEPKQPPAPPPVIKRPQRPINRPAVRPQRPTKIRAPPPQIENSRPIPREEFAEAPQIQGPLIKRRPDGFPNRRRIPIKKRRKITTTTTTTTTTEEPEYYYYYDYDDTYYYDDKAVSTTTTSTTTTTPAPVRRRAGLRRRRPFQQRVPQQPQQPQLRTSPSEVAVRTFRHAPDYIYEEPSFRTNFRGTEDNNRNGKPIRTFRRPL